MTIPTRLPTRVADELATRALRAAADAAVLPDAPMPDWDRYKQFRRQVRETFQVPDTTITPLMARVLYGVAHLIRPRRLLVVGSYYGNTLVWLTGPGFGPLSSYHGEYGLGVDVDEEAVAGCRANLARLGLPGRVDTRVLDGHLAGAGEDPFDLVLLDADDPVARKEVYLSLLAALYPRIAPGGVVLAHDICVPVFADQMARYRRAVRDRRRFAASVSLEIDRCGLELSRREERS